MNCSLFFRKKVRQRKRGAEQRDACVRASDLSSLGTPEPEGRTVQALKVALLAIVGMQFGSVSWATVTLSAATGFSNSVTPAGATTANLYYSNIGGSGSKASCNTTLNPACTGNDQTPSMTAASNSAASAGSGQMCLWIGGAPSEGTPLVAVGGQSLGCASPAGQSGTFSSQTFSYICNHAFAVKAAGNPAIPTTPDANCTSAGETGGTADSIPLTFIYDKNSSGNYESASDEVLTVTVYFMSNISANNSNGTTGITAFTVKPGDGKVRIKNVSSDGNFPNSTNGIGVQYVEFLYATGGFTNIQFVNPGNGASANGVFTTTVNPTTFQITNNTITGLTNNVQYYFRVGLVDNAGNLGFENTDNTSDHTATPDQVAGLITKNFNCFIATAAFGSPIAPQVETLRQFRDRFLLRTYLGKHFVKWYYAHSPAWAEKIRANNNARAVVRTALYPAVGFSWMALKIGAANAGLLVALVLMLPILIWRYSITPLPKKKKLLGIIFLAMMISPAKAKGQDDFIDQPDLFSIEPKKEKPRSFLKNKTQRPPPAQEEEDIPEPEIVEEPEPGTAPLPQNAQVPAQPNPDEFPVAPPAEEEGSVRPPVAEEEEQPIVPTEKETGDSYRVVPNYAVDEMPKLEQKTKSGTYVYRTIPSPQNYSAGFQMGPFQPSNLKGDTPGINYGTVYNNQQAQLIDLSFEWQFFKHAGKLGLRTDLGFFSVAGNGRFVHNPAVQADETISMTGFPIGASAIYHLQFADKQIPVPFALAGGDYIGFFEYRPDLPFNQAFKFAGAPAAHWAAGIQIQLDFLDPSDLWELDNEYGVNHIYLTADFRQIIGLSRTFDFSASIFEGGIQFEF